VNKQIGVNDSKYGVAGDPGCWRPPQPNFPAKNCLTTGIPQ